MAVQINEVVIRAVVDPAPPAGSSPQATQCASEGSGGSSAESELAEKILEIIREKLER
jgi:hypothetical protein